MSAEYSSELFALAMPDNRDIITAADELDSATEIYFKSCQTYAQKPNEARLIRVTESSEYYGQAAVQYFRAIEQDYETEPLSFANECLTVILAMDTRRVSKLNDILGSPELKPSVYEPFDPSKHEWNPDGTPDQEYKTQLCVNFARMILDMTDTDTTDFIQNAPTSY
jgi:hypothetical protein